MPDKLIDTNILVYAYDTSEGRKHEVSKNLLKQIWEAGCWSQGATEQEAIENIQDAIREYLEAVNDLFPNAEVREIEVAV